MLAGLASAVVAGVFWFPPIAQQVTGTPGNAGVLLDYLREGPAAPSVSTSDAVRAIATAPNQRVVVVPIEAAALAGTLGGIGELTRSVFGDGTPAPRRTVTPPNVAPPRA